MTMGRAGQVCDKCFQTKSDLRTLGDVVGGQSDTVICRGCSYKINESTNFLSYHGYSITPPNPPTEAKGAKNTPSST